MSYDQLMQLYFERSTALQNYWTLYVVVIGGLLAFSSMRQRRDRTSTILISVLFIFFAYKNLGGIKDVTFQRYGVVEAIKEYSRTDGGGDPTTIERSKRLIEPTLTYPSYEGAFGVKNFHIVTDALVVVALWAFELRRRRMAEETARAAVVR